MLLVHHIVPIFYYNELSYYFILIYEVKWENKALFRILET